MGEGKQYLTMPCLSCGGREAITIGDELRCAGCAANFTEPEVQRRPFCGMCPECGQNSFRTPEDLGTHLERHRPVDTAKFSTRGIPLSRECPKGCGRWFVVRRSENSTRQALESKELNAHVRLCDGSEPLPIGKPGGTKDGKEDEMAKRKCPAEGCEFRWSGPRELGKHYEERPEHRQKKTSSNGKAKLPRKKRTLRIQPSRNGHATSWTPEQLRRQAKDLREKAEEINAQADKADQAADKLESLLKEIDQFVEA